MLEMIFRPPGNQHCSAGGCRGLYNPELQKVLLKLVEPFRQSDRDEVIACLKQQGGLEACRLAFYTDHDIGKDRVWDNWRLEGPAFVWHFRGAPHVHVWGNVADNSSVATNTPFTKRNRRS